MKWLHTACPDAQRSQMDVKRRYRHPQHMVELV